MNPILTFLFVLLLVCPGFAKDKKPNVVMLLADDLGWKDIGCYGGPVAARSCTTCRKTQTSGAI